MSKEEIFVKNNNKLLNKSLKAEKKLERQMNRLYRNIFKEIERDIFEVFSKYATDNKLSYDDAIKNLTSKEYSTWRMELKDYIKEIEESGDELLEFELRTLEAKRKISRLEQLMCKVKLRLHYCFEYTNEEVEKLLEKSVMESYEDTSKNLIKAYQFDMVIDPTHDIIFEVLNTPWSGATFKELISNHSKKLEGIIKNELVKGFYQGKSSQHICKVIQGKVDRSKKEIMALVRTERTYCQNEVQRRKYEEVGFKYYKYKAKPEQARTCDKCAKLHNKPFKLSEAVINENFPPMHTNCRCSTVPLTDEDYKKEMDKIKAYEKYKKDVEENYSEYNDKGEFEPF